MFGAQKDPSRTEKATPKRVNKQRQEGNVPKSAELGKAVSLLGGMLAGYTVVDPATVIATHLTEVFKRHLSDFLDRQAVQGLLDTLGKNAPKAVEDLVPGVLPLGVVQKVLQLLVRENVSIRDMGMLFTGAAGIGGAALRPQNPLSGLAA